MCAKKAYLDFGMSEMLIERNHSSMDFCQTSGSRDSWQRQHGMLMC